MIPNLDVDLLKTFIAIAELGSFTRAAGEVHKTQSAVSMQMKRLEELTGRAIFVREGRANRLTADGERLLDYARRIVRLNDEALATFMMPELTGLVRFGTPDDYAERFLPEILARFSRTHPLVQVDVECLGSTALYEKTMAGDIDLAMITCFDNPERVEVIRREPLVWAASGHHCVLEQEVLPLAVSHTGCGWRAMVINALEATGRKFRIAYASANSNAINAAVSAGLAVAGLPELVLRPGFKVLTEDDGFPPLGVFEIGLVRAPEKKSGAIDALASHITGSLAARDVALLAAE